MAILFATLSPSSDIPSFEITIPHFDKIFHFGLFFIHGLVISIALKTNLRWFKAFFIGLALAIFTEYFQSYVPGRQTDVLDGLADVVGTTFGLLAVYVKEKNIPNN